MGFIDGSGNSCWSFGSLFRRRNHQFRLMNSDAHFGNERKCRRWEETRKFGGRCEGSRIDAR